MICILDEAGGIYDDDAFLDVIEDGLQQVAFAGESLYENSEVRRIEVIGASENAVKRALAFSRGHEGHGISHCPPAQATTSFCAVLSVVSSSLR